MYDQGSPFSYLFPKEKCKRSAKMTKRKKTFFRNPTNAAFSIPYFAWLWN
jgi:hypothetical protein